MSPRSIEVTWDPPIANVTGYVISYDGVENFADDGNVSVGRTTTSSIITGLEEFVDYAIRVQAVFGLISVYPASIRITTWSDSKLNNY